jgi:hypothetical protein
MVPPDKQARESDNIMTTTSENITLAPSIDAVAFTFTPKALEAADAWHRATKADVKASVAFYDMLIDHSVDPVLLKKPDGRAFTNMEAAGFDFTLRLYFRVKLGAACATAIFDDAVPKETVLKPTGLTASGTVIKPQPKKNLRSSYGHPDQWGVFVRDLIAIKDAKAAEKAAAAGIEVPVPTKAKPVLNDDNKFFLELFGRAIKRAKKPVEKQDGSVAPDVMRKIDAAVAGLLAEYGIKAK